MTCKQMIIISSQQRGVCTRDKLVEIFGNLGIHSIEDFFSIRKMSLYIKKI